MAIAKEHHVVHNPSGGWDVKRAGGKRATLHTRTKKEAVSRGREVSHHQGTELVTHNMDGKISAKDSHGRDPYPPRG